MSSLDDPLLEEPASAAQPVASGPSRDEVRLARAIRKGKVAPQDWKGDDWDDPDDVLVFGTGRVRPDRRFIGRILALVAVLVVVGLLIGGGIGLWALRQVNPPGEAGTAVAFNVSESDTLAAVSHRLEDAGIITNAGVFEWYVKRKGGIEFTAGDYSLKPKDTMGNIVSALRTPPAQTFRKVTFPEGFTVKQMTERISKEINHISPAQFTKALTDGSVKSKYLPQGQKSLEGVLFPDTYQVAGNETATKVAQRMSDLMARVGGQEGLDNATARVGVTPYQALIVASIVEREAKTDADRYKIARVIYNRMFFGMPLQVDATLYYGQDGSKPFDQLKAIDTPYNTYLHSGLPPTPIANPGRASIRAALNPAANPLPGDPLCKQLADDVPCVYLYYVLSDANGNHAFAVTAEQHAANVARARAAGIIK
jgi:UPF0755 protein